MAFDYGSIDLGLRNPFKKEGLVTAIRGGIQSLVGVYLLIQAAANVKTNTLLGWILVVFGLYLLTIGIRAASAGIFAMLRYFVGRNHPTSLAYNYSKSEASIAKEESEYVAYKRKTLEEMLVGRKNATFTEPQGFLARLFHSFLPKLLFMPYPIRNMAQRLFGAWIKTLTAMLAYALVAFVSLAGFAGDIGEMVFPIYSILLMLYLIFVWRYAGLPASRQAEHHIESLGTGDLVKVTAVSIIMPVIIGVSLSFLLDKRVLSTREVEHWLAMLPSLHSTGYLITTLLAAGLCSALLVFLFAPRLKQANPVAEVSELRENWQESVHPNEIFINLDNLVMANRRYKEVPNRVYLELDPHLNEQVEGKGGFKGELIQEIQPRVKPMELGNNFTLARFASLIAGNILHLVATLFIVLMAYAVYDLYQAVQDSSLQHLNAENLPSLSALHYLLLAVLIKAFANLLVNAAHLFYAEIQFESLLIYFKCEGTFTESKISTGTGIHDSTRSENTLVRSSITPWVIVSRIVSTTFAATGMKNLEHPRHILEMHKSEQELNAIRNDVIGFLKDRESIASITSARDVGNASQIYELNQQTRAHSEQQHLDQKNTEEAAGYLRQQDDTSDSPE